MQSPTASASSQIDPALLGVDEDREGETPPPTQDLTQFSIQGAGEDGSAEVAQSLEHEVLNEGIRERVSFASRASRTTPSSNEFIVVVEIIQRHSVVGV